ncbi:MAG: Sjogren's syndrome/scleroderma autoantigen 1 family protein [Candidatus Nitrosocaldaceae archaeon]
MSNIASAAELIRKGGTLLADPCEVCKGVQIKFKDGILCINCGKKTETEKIVEKTEPKEVIKRKINECILHLNGEDDINKQLDITKLIISYITILDKIKDLEI